MADLSYNVRVNTQDAQRSINGLRTALGGLAAAFSIQQITRFGDSLTNLQNKLRTLSPAVGEAEKQFKAIAAIAIASRAPLEATGDLFFRIARAADALGISQREVATITDTLAKGLTSSGLSAQEAAGPLLQLGQALQSGRFQGDELRSILEGMPIVATALADELGVTVGQLRDLGSEGKITGDVFVRAMQRARGGIVEAFGRTLPTISQALSTVQTSAALAFNEFENNTGVGRSAAAAIELIGFQIFQLSKNIDAVIGPLKTLVQIVGTVVAFTVAGRVIRALGAAITATFTAFSRFGSFLGDMRDRIKGFSEIMAMAGSRLGNFGYAVGFVLQPILQLAAGLGSVIAAVATFLGIDKLFDWFKSLGETGSDAQQQLQTYREELLKYQQSLNDTAGSSTNAAASQAELGTKIANVRRQLVEAAQAYNNQTNELERQLRIQNELVNATQLQRDIDSALRQAESAYLAEATRLQQALADAKRSSNEEERAQIPLLLEQLARLDQRYRDNMATIRELVTEQENLVRARNLEQFATQQQQRVTDELIRLQREMARSSMTDIERKYFDIANAADDAARAAIRAEEARRGSPLTAQEQEEYFRRARAGNEAIIRQTRQLHQQSRTFASGWQKAWRDYAEAAQDASKTAENVFRKATQGMEDALVNFVKTGRFEWRDFVADILEELLRSNIRELIASFGSALNLGGLFGGNGGGGQTRGASPTNPLFVVDVAGGGVAGGAAGGGNLLGSIGSIFGGGQPVRTPGINPNAERSSGGGFLGTVGNVLGSIGSGIGSAVKTVASGIGSAIGGVVSGIRNIFGGFFATGGVLPAGKFGVVGERGPELITGPAGITPMSGLGGVTNVTYNIQAVDAASFQSLVARDPGFIYGVTELGRRKLARG